MPTRPLFQVTYFIYGYNKLVYNIIKSLYPNCKTFASANDELAKLMYSLKMKPR